MAMDSEKGTGAAAQAVQGAVASAQAAPSETGRKRMPVVFSGHGSPMLALADDEVAHGLARVGRRIVEGWGKPRAILAVSAHWCTDGLFVQSAAEPRQIYDMYGFPPELYEVKYPVKGDAGLTGRVRDLLGGRVGVDDGWGIDHGTWTVLVHMFPDASVPVVQLSVDATRTPAELFEAGRLLAPLRDEGYLVLGSGNVVHNLGRVDWERPDSASEETRAFDADVVSRVLAHDDAGVLGYEALPHARYAAPTPEHFLPLVYLLGAADGDDAEVFNDVCNLGSIAMTGFLFGAQ